MEDRSLRDVARMVANGREWSRMVPAIKFNPEWEIAVIPPFSGAMARFIVKHGERHASVYLDCFDSLGFFGEPYWEV